MTKEITLSALLALLAPTDHALIVHHLGANISEAVGEGTAEELRAARCVEVCGENVVERITLDAEGYPWEITPCLLITIGGKGRKK